LAGIVNSSGFCASNLRKTVEHRELIRLHLMSVLQAVSFRVQNNSRSTGAGRMSVVRQPYCDESGVGFGVAGAEKPTALWSHHSILGSDETWLPEWSGKPGGVELCAVRSRGCLGASQSFG
jgi:hypothetical protein